MLIFSDSFLNEPLNSLQRRLIVFAEEEAVTDNAVKEFFINETLVEENVLSRLCEEGIAVGEDLRKAAHSDLEQLLNKTAEFEAYVPSKKRKMRFFEYGKSLERIIGAKNTEDTLNALISHYSAYGGGDGAKYVAFKWDKKLCGISEFDKTEMSELYCIEEQKQQIVRNTAAFLECKPANNVLLYGNSGCGKSTVVKALINKYCNNGLRLVQMCREDLSELPQLLDILRRKKFRFIVYLDDLSFEEHDMGYKAIKSVLDGRLEKQPENVLFYATSNRLHLVSEHWAERKGDDIHASDTRHEKISLSERFGIRISFLSPNQSEYLKIVEGILCQRGIVFTDEIRAEALKWAINYNGRSGRTAVQFVNTI